MGMVLSELVDIVGEAHVSTRESDRLAYATDWWWVPQMWLDRAEEPVMPDVIVHPGSPEEIARVLQVANTYRIPVVPWGGGSGTQGGATPIYGGILLDVKRLDKLIEIDEVSMTVTAQAGLNGTQLEWALNEKGLTLPHYPASANCATLGGYLAARGSGTISTKYGKAEDLVLSIQIVLPDGTITRTPPVRSHATGPGLLNFLVGSEGTMGVITEATMQIERQPETRLFRAVLFEDLNKALEAGRRIMTARLQPTVIRLYDQASTVSLVKRVLGLDLQGAYMVLGFDGFPEIAAAQEKRALDICADLGARDLGREPGEEWWHHRYDFYYPPLGLSLPKLYGTIETVSTFANIEKLYWAKKHAIEDGFAQWKTRYIAHFSHWFPWGVMVYDRFIVDEPPADAREVLRLHNNIWTVAARTSLAHGGMLNEHHGIGLKLGRLMREQYGAGWPAMDALKQTLDPRGIMNPGKLGFSVGPAA
ncbi:MAG: FAD-binding oxidoreductase [Anaerolineales bacterium]|nr:FAD-binding oxidoreductase [Anaerolineales bacterium]